jgi:hypothetical protein
MGPELRHAIVQYPGGLRAGYRWTGSGTATALFALTEAGGPLRDLGDRVDREPDRLCRAELRVETPVGPWTVRLASTISDEPAGLLWDAEGLLVVKYGFHAYALGARDGELRWLHRSASPILAVLGAPRLPHVLIQAEIETFALEADGTVGWRVGHSDVVTDVDLVGSRLQLGSFAGQRRSLDPLTGRTTG